MKNLYIFTGKGGVGKTSCSLAFCQYLQEQKKQTVYLTFDETTTVDFSQDPMITHLNFELWDCVGLYLEQKFSSKIIAAVIMKTPFFRALIKMVPGFQYVIYLGRLVHLLKSSNDITYVLDSPSSGHLLTLFESAHLFKNIFGEGILAKDLNESLEYWNTVKPYQLNIVALAKPSVLQESSELQTMLQDKFEMNSHIFVNCSLPMALEREDNENLPDFLRKKKNTELQAIERFDSELKGQLPYSPALEYKNLVTELASYCPQFHS